MNVKHPENELRKRAKDAKRRLKCNDYNKDEINAPQNATPQQKKIFLKLLSLKRSGEENINPVSQFADINVLKSLPYEEKQRYIMQICADYISMKNQIDKGQSS